MASLTVNAIPLEVFLVFAVVSIALFILSLLSKKSIFALLSFTFNLITMFMAPLVAEVQAGSSTTYEIYYPHMTIVMWIFLALAMLSIPIFILKFFAADVGGE